MTPKQTLDGLGHHADWLGHATADPATGTHRLDVERLDPQHLFDLARLALEGWLVRVRPRTRTSFRIYLTPKEA